MILKTYHKVGLSLFFIVVLSGAFIALLPDPIDIDLTKIGNGRPSVVFVYDPNRLVSNQQALQFNKAKARLHSNTNFLIARTGYPETAKFRHAYEADIAELIFFDGQGNLVDRQFAVIDADELIRRLGN